jgi:tryptophan 2,3-dioxygenase
MEITPELKEKLSLLNEKYAALGEDFNAYLEGLLYADVTTYWDYIQLDTLLSLQKPKTSFPDEVVFIMYHQITELYFKLALREFEALGNIQAPTKAHFIDRVSRINRYFDALVKSFEIMINGMDREEFLKFRMSLLPASGFQSAQYREIEIFSTDFINLVAKDLREQLKEETDFTRLFEHIYWKAGATEVASGKKTLTLIQFEEKYRDQFIALANNCQDKNLWQVYLRLSEADQADENVRQALRQNDINVNINWPLAHYKSYLPPRFQKRIFYPSLWSAEEQENWGKAWVEETFS